MQASTNQLQRSFKGKKFPSFLARDYRERYLIFIRILSRERDGGETISKLVVCCCRNGGRDASITPRRRMDLDRFFCFSIAYKRIRNGQELNFHRRLTRDGRELATPLLFLAFTKDISSGSARFLLSSSTKRNKKKRKRKKGEGEFSILESRQ